MDRLTAVVTGASRGFGAVVAEAFAEAGVRVVIGARDADALASVRDDLDEATGPVVPVRTDVRDEFDLERLMASAADAGGQIDVLVANAAVDHGSTDATAFADESYARFDDHFRTNVRGVFASMKEAIPHMADGGRIFLISCASGGLGERGSYGVSKIAAEAVARRYAAELGPAVGVVHVGSIESDTSDDRSGDMKDRALQIVRMSTEWSQDRLDGRTISLADSIGG